MLNVYMDESGDPSDLSLSPEASKFFVVSAIVCSDNEARKIRNSLDAISNRYFKGSELKSSKISPNNEAWKEILDAILKNKIDIIIIGVDKVKFKEVIADNKFLLKYVLNLTSKKVFASNRMVTIYYDETEGKTFRDSLQNHIERTYSRKRTGKSAFHFLHSSDRLIQAADIIAVVYYRYLTGKNAIYTDLVKYIKESSRIIYEQIIPGVRKVYERSADPLVNMSSVLYENNIERIMAVIEELHSQENTNDIKGAIVCAKLLLFNSDNNYGRMTQEEISPFLVQQEIKFSDPERIGQIFIAKIKDSGVVISTNSYGYKLAESVEDVNDAIKDNEMRIMRALKRICEMVGNVSELTSARINMYKLKDQRPVLKLAQYYETSDDFKESNEK